MKRLTAVLMLILPLALIVSCKQGGTTFYSGKYTPADEDELRYDIDVAFGEGSEYGGVQMVLHEYYRKRFLGSYVTNVVSLKQNDDHSLHAILDFPFSEMNGDEETITTKHIFATFVRDEGSGNLLLKDVKSDLFEAKGLVLKHQTDTAFVFGKRPQVVGALAYLELYGPVKTCRWFTLDRQGRVLDDQSGGKFTYDDQGRLTQYEVDMEKRTIFYNSRNQVVKIVETSSTSKTIRIVYDRKGDASTKLITWDDGTTDKEVVSSMKGRDDYGNWTCRESVAGQNLIMSEERTVTYHE